MATKKAAVRKKVAKKTPRSTKTPRTLVKHETSPKTANGVSATGNATSTSTKQLGMLSKPNGTTIDALMKATGWQQHSVRGFLAGVVRKKLKLNLVSEQRDNQPRLYRIVEGETGRPSQAKPKRAG